VQTKGNGERNKNILKKTKKEGRSNVHMNFPMDEIIINNKFEQHRHVMMTHSNHQSVTIFWSHKQDGTAKNHELLLATADSHDG
jgi:hypothetical protein